MWKSVRIRIAMAVLALIFRSGVLHAQVPCDPSVTPTKYDGLQSSQFPVERQNTENFKVNMSPWNGLELDVDFPYLTIQRAAGFDSSHGVGDTNLGTKWSFPAATPGRFPKLGHSAWAWYSGSRATTPA